MAAEKSRYIQVARIAYQLSKQALPPYSNAKSPHHFTLPQLGACVLLMHYLRLSYRDMEEWLLATEVVCKELELPRVPNYATIQRTYTKMRELNLVCLNETLLNKSGKPEEQGIAADWTGFSTTPTSFYYQSRSEKSYPY